MKSTESQIQTAICDYLALKKHFFWRANNTPIFQMDNGKPRFRAMPKYSMRGVPDIILIKDGQFIGIEVKQPKAKQSEGQIEFQKKCYTAGGKYYVVTSIEEVQKLGL